MVQSLLMMTYQHNSLYHHKDPWYWMGVAVSVAHRLGLRRDPGDSRRHQRILWWTLYMRDTLLALAFQKVPLIEDQEHSVRQPTIDDFDLDSSGSASAEILPSGRRKQMAIVFVEKAKLAVFIRQCLSSQKASLLHQHRPPGLGPGEPALDASTARQYIRLLEDWHGALPPSAQYPTMPVAASQEEETLYSHRALLQALYLSFSIILHRAHPDPFVRHTIFSATDQLLAIVQDLQQRGLIRTLSTTDVLIILRGFVASITTGCEEDDRRCQRRRVGAVLRNEILPRFQQDCLADDVASVLLDAIRENTCNL
ncbi:hypothetical protein VTN77DRAFT_4979 [Rasamsonia byssochlamydoides]|uniref:uncharacterized protein n=1 Tax=Rasamsonia byssochlamydoides TaxID=89139 RepID=UPI003742097D